MKAQSLLERPYRRYVERVPIAILHAFDGKEDTSQERVTRRRPTACHDAFYHGSAHAKDELRQHLRDSDQQAAGVAMHGRWQQPRADRTSNTAAHSIALPRAIV